MSKLVPMATARSIVDEIPYRLPPEVSFVEEHASSPRVIDLLRSHELIVGESSPNIALVIRAYDVPGLYVCPEPDEEHLLLIVGSNTFDFFDHRDLTPLRRIYSRLRRTSDLRRILYYRKHSPGRNIDLCVARGLFTNEEAEAIRRSGMSIPTIVPGDMFVGVTNDAYPEIDGLNKVLTRAKINRAFRYNIPTRLPLTQEYFLELYKRLYVFACVRSDFG